MLCFDVEKMLQEGVSPEAIKVLLAKDLYEHVDSAAQEMERQKEKAEAEEKARLAAEALGDCRENLVCVLCEYMEELGLLSDVNDEDYVDFIENLQQSLEKELIALEVLLGKSPKANKQTKILPFPAAPPQKESVNETKNAAKPEVPPCISKILPTDAKVVPIKLSDKEASEILAKFLSQIK